MFNHYRWKSRELCYKHDFCCLARLNSHSIIISQVVKVKQTLFFSHQIVKYLIALQILLTKRICAMFTNILRFCKKCQILAIEPSLKDIPQLTGVFWWGWDSDQNPGGHIFGLWKPWRPFTMIIRITVFKKGEGVCKVRGFTSPQFFR